MDFLVPITHLPVPGAGIARNVAGMIATDFLVHIANLLVLASFMARNMLLLRGLNLAATAFFLAYFLMQPSPLWATIGWNLVFACINVFQTWRIILERRSPTLSAEEQQLRHVAFQDLPPRPYRRLLDLGRGLVRKLERPAA
ncbi:MAG: hypothetical protein VKS61_02130 [Candidatus Sericytochromatia bacterium]|nr:hypothetical protein [Candidatus Sericytochromatia bacterium]